uniref:beta-glucosidase n=1 Tax=Rasamsonia emersonii TaxID=68825 RepID=Q8TGI8_RASEM|nr:beta-glucosidase [Rasamsonia emersonii]5JU6_A Chain A, Beta-glucosidase [Rasamsonia emersonii]5JU6_B Chain B, Beta-glucosidase [Rasamsonia emersonii]5JU6_C Chain C, Beta-glucosidase [Rasamsonia emersonii]5JU6_D Chain D, Beta-glucosidase [Rasamsonia emersonii]
MRNGLLKVAALAAASAVNGENLAYSPPFYPSPWANGQGDWAEAYQKAVQFVSQLTLAEKVNLTTGTGWEQDRCVGQVGSIPRLGFPGLCMQDSPLGVRDTDYNSAFPAGVNVAATWDRNLAYRRGVAMGEEHRGKGVDVQLGPVAGPLGRSPDAGRNWEGFAPDPVLTGNMMASTIQGIQDAGVIACAKHFILYEQEHFRQGAQDGYDISDSISANADDKTMHELYLWPFADAVRAGVGSVMCSYNQVNNSYACSNSYTMNKLLKSELGFQGFVMTDWGGHHSGVGSALAGLDMSMPGDIAFDSGTSFWGTNLTVAVLNGSIPEWRVDDMAVRIMSAYYKVGRDRYSVPINFDSWTLDTYGPEHYAVGQGQTKINEHVDVRGNHAEIIHEIGAASAVLLKNKGGLPLTGTERFVGVFGKDAGSNPWGVNGCSDRGCDNGTLAMGWGSGTANFPYLVTPEQAIQREVLSRNGTFTGITDNGALAEMAAAASQADTCLVFANADSGEGYITVDGNEGDRKNLTLWQGADQVIHNVSANCNNTVVVLHTVGPVLIDDWYDHPNVTAILWAGLPGQESGNSLVDVLYGRVNPGKTPFTWGRARDDYGAPLIVKPNNGKGAPQQDFTEGIFIDYRRFDKYNITPIYEFGFGLSYTTFEFSQLNVQPINAPPYTPASGFTKAAQSFGQPSNASDNLYPSDIERVPLYIYPWLNSTDLKASANDPDYGLPTEKYVPPNATNGDPQPIDPAGGAPGGNPSLYEPVARVTTIITNTGKVTGDEVPQLYVSLGGPDDAPKVLRGFDRITLAPGQQYLWTTTLTRRDISNWDPVTQNWVVTNYTKTIYVGNSSRNLPLQAPLKPYPGI